MLNWIPDYSRKEMATSIKSGRGNLRVLPYVKHRLVFAEMAARLLAEERFDCLLVDYPNFLHDQDCLEMPLSRLPLVSSLLIAKDEDSYTYFPFTPNDAGCLGLYWAWKHHLPWRCVDDSRLANYPAESFFLPPLVLRDDVLVFKQGLEGYFAPLWKQLEGHWERTTSLQRYFSAVRAAAVGDRLQEMLASGKRVVFLCEYRLWWLVRKWLSGGLARPASPLIHGPERRAALIVENPMEFWISGLLDDYPAINHLFWRALPSGNLQNFDKLTLLARLVGEAFDRDRSNAAPPSIRLAAIFSQYLQRRLASSRRATPHPTEHLFEAAASCVSRDFAFRLAEKLLAYPFPEDILQEPLMYLTLTSTSHLRGGAKFLIGEDMGLESYPGQTTRNYDRFHPYGADDQRRYWAQTGRYRETVGVRLKTDFFSVRWAVKEDYDFHAAVSGFIKGRLKSSQRLYRVKKSWGSLGEGIDWKSTLGARARGSRSLRVRKKVARGMGLTVDDFTPLVVILAPGEKDGYLSLVHDSNMTNRMLELGKITSPPDSWPQPDKVYSVLATVTKSEWLWETHVRREYISSLAILYTNGVMGLKRYGAIMRKPTSYQCRMDPRRDEELTPFPLTERGLAWALKYAGKEVVVAAPQGWRPSAGITEFARQRGKVIITTPLNLLKPAVLRRLRTMHTISTSLKNHPANAQIARRFIGVR